MSVKFGNAIPVWKIGKVLPTHQLIMTENPATPDEQDKNDEDNLESKLPKIISFESLARCGDEVWIENAGQIYRLRRTRQGKLILTK